MLRGYNRILHPLRRSGVRRAIRGPGIPETVVFVCHGNICRSPYAEGALRRELSPALRRRIRVESVGFVQPGRASPGEAIRVAAERGVDLVEHRSRVLDGDILEAADMMFVMEGEQRSAIMRKAPRGRVLLLGDLDPSPVDRRRIRDPVMQPVNVFRRVYSRIDRCVQELAELFESGVDSGETRVDG